MSHASNSDLRTEALLALLAGSGNAADRLAQLHPRRDELAAMPADPTRSLARVLGAEAVAGGAALTSWVGIPLRGPVPLASALEYYIARHQQAIGVTRARKGGQP